MSVAAVRSPTEYEDRLRSYLFERAEEGRAVRVGEKEVSEQAAIIARYPDLFTRDQLEALRSAEESAGDEDRGGATVWRRSDHSFRSGLVTYLPNARARGDDRSLRPSVQRS